MATSSVIKQHDTKLTFTDRPTIDGVQMLMSSMAGCSVKFLLKCDLITPPKIVIQPATIAPDPLDNTKAYFTYDPAPADVDTIGSFKQEWELTFASGKLLSFPNGGYNKVKIIADLG